MKVKMCISPHTNKPVRVCDRDEGSKEPGRMKCCMCVGTRDYIEVDKLNRWIYLLSKSGIGSKQIVLKEMIGEVEKDYG